MNFALELNISKSTWSSKSRTCGKSIWLWANSVSEDLRKLKGTGKTHQLRRVNNWIALVDIDRVKAKTKKKQQKLVSTDVSRRSNVHTHLYLKLHLNTTARLCPSFPELNTYQTAPSVSAAPARLCGESSDCQLSWFSSCSWCLSRCRPSSQSKPSHSW